MEVNGLSLLQNNFNIFGLKNYRKGEMFEDKRLNSSNGKYQ